MSAAARTCAPNAGVASSNRQRSNASMRVQALECYSAEEMLVLTSAVDEALGASNWYAALITALTLPDIAGRIDDPVARSRARYERWVESHLSPGYTLFVGPSRTPRKLLSGGDCYALRCKFLHEGSHDTSTAPAKDILEGFQFLAPRAEMPGLQIHRNHVGTKLQLQVDLFCRDICAAVHTWLAGIPDSDTARRERLVNFATIQTCGPILI